MSKEGQKGWRRPCATWAQFLESPSDPISVMWWKDQCFTSDFAPLVRAVAFYDNFEARVSSDGLGAYIRLGHLLPCFEEAAECVADHPLLAKPAAMIRKVLANADFVGDMNRTSTTTEALAMEERHSDFKSEIETSANAMFRAVRPRLNREVLENLATYVDMERPTGLSGVGVETAEIADRDLKWTIRFVDGFPIGPNTTEPPTRLVHYSVDHMEVDFDQYGERRWFDFRTGEGGRVIDGVRVRD